MAEDGHRELGGVGLSILSERWEAVTAAVGTWIFWCFTNYLKGLFHGEAVGYLKSGDT